MTMKWSVRGGALVIVMAVSAALAEGPGKEGPGGPTPARKVPTVHYILASPRAYLAGDATQHMIDYSAMTGAAENFGHPALRKARVIEVPVGTRVVFAGQQGAILSCRPMNKGIGN